VLIGPSLTGDAIRETNYLKAAPLGEQAAWADGWQKGELLATECFEYTQNRPKCCSIRCGDICTTKTCQRTCKQVCTRRIAQRLSPYVDFP